MRGFLDGVGAMIFLFIVLPFMIRMGIAAWVWSWALAEKIIN